MERSLAVYVHTEIVENISISVHNIESGDGQTYRQLAKRMCNTLIGDHRNYCHILIFSVLLN